LGEIELVEEPHLKENYTPKETDRMFYIRRKALDIYQKEYLKIFNTSKELLIDQLQAGLTYHGLEQIDWQKNPQIKALDKWYSQVQPKSDPDPMIECLYRMRLSALLYEINYNEPSKNNDIKKKRLNYVENVSLMPTSDASPTLIELKTTLKKAYDYIKKVVEISDVATIGALKEQVIDDLEDKESSLNFGVGKELYERLVHRFSEVETLLLQGFSGLGTMDEGLGDQAMRSKAPGGIDLNPTHLEFQIKRDVNGILLPLSQQPLINMRIEGLTPVIVNITPVINLPELLGVSS
jgi:hypothetical protein